LQEPIGRHLRWETLQWIDKEILLPPTLRSRRPPRTRVADLVGSVLDAEGRYLEVLLHPELQARTDREMDRRALRYNAGLTLQRDAPNVPVVTVVFYHCKGAPGVHYHWCPQEFYGQTTLGVGYWSVGLGEMDAREYAEKDNPMAWALASWMRQPRRGRARLRLRLQERIIRSVEEETYRDVLLETVRTQFHLSERDEDEERRLIRDELDREVRVEMLTAFDKLRLEGERHATQESLLEFLAARFQTLPEGLEERVRQIHDLDRLHALIRRSGSARTLQEALAGLEDRSAASSR